MNLRHLLMLISLCLLAACGGGSSTPDLEGVWSGTYNPDPTNGPIPFHAMIRNGGPGIFFDDNDLVFVMAQTPGDSTLSEGAETYPAYGFIFSNNQSTLGTDFQGTASSGSLVGKLTVNGGQAQFNLHRGIALSGTPSVVAGLWSGTVIGSSNVAFHVAASGAVTGSDSFGCSFTGQITQIGTEDLFTVSLHSTGFSGICGHQLTGLAYQSDTDQLGIDGHAAGTYYYLAAYDSTVAIAAELKVQ
jgi:hypothetical protein